MTQSAWTLLLLSLLGVNYSLVNAQGAPKLNVDAKEKVIKGGELFEFICRAGRPIETCSIKFASGLSFKIRENAEKPDYKYYGAGFQKGDCGIKYNSIKPDQHGNVTCTVGYPDIDVESTGFTNLIVAAPPTSIDLRARNEYNEGEEMRISCTATGARPPPVVTLLLDNNTLATSAKMQETVNFNRVASLKDNGKRLVCKVTHVALEEPKMTEKTLTVFFKPQPANQFNGPIQKFGFFEGKEGIISVDVFANPKPRLEWRINGEFPDRTKYLPVENDKIQQNEKTCAWVAELLINPVSAEDLDKDFVLTAINQHGYEVYNVKISFSPTPPDDDTDFGYLNDHAIDLCSGAAGRTVLSAPAVLSGSTASLLVPTVLPSPGIKVNKTTQKKTSINDFSETGPGSGKIIAGTVVLILNVIVAITNVTNLCIFICFKAKIQ